MKRLILIISLVLFCLPSLVRADFWVKAYYDSEGLNYRPSGRFLLPTQDGNYVLVGGGRFGADSSKFWVAKVDSEGDVLWVKSISASNMRYSVYSFRPAGEGFVASTHFRSDLVENYGYYTASIIKLDANANIEWQHFYLNKIYYSQGGQLSFYYHPVFLYGIRKTVDGGYIAIGSIHPNGPYDDSDILLLKLDPNGGVNWSVIIDAINENGYSLENDGLDVIQTENGSFIGIGNVRGHGVIFKFSKNGGLVWQKVFKSYPESMNVKPLEIEKTADGKYLIYEIVDSHPGLLKIDSDGNILWHKQLGGPAYSGYGNIRFASGGDILLATGPWLYRLNSNGTVQWAHLYPNRFLTQDIHEIEDGYLTLSGDRFNLAKLNPNGYSCLWTEDENVTAEEIDIPLAENITLELSPYDRIIEVMDSNFTSTAVQLNSTDFCRKYSLTLDLEGEGTVSSYPQGIQCPETCSALFDGGTNVTLYAHPLSGSFFLEWGGDCASCGSNTSCDLVILDDTACTARFGKLPVIDSFSADPTSGVAPLTVNFTCEAYDPDGTIVEYQWDFDGDNVFDETTEIGSVTHTYEAAGTYEARCKVVDNDGAEAVSDPEEITVQALPTLYTLTINPVPEHGSVLVPEEGGQISCGLVGEDCSESYEEGTEVTLYAEPDEGYRFIGWSGDCEGCEGTTCTIVMDSDKTCSAEFEEVAGPMPDLMVVRILTPRYWMAGRFTIVTVLIENRGEADVTEPFDVHLYLNPFVEVIDLGTQKVNGLAAGQRKLVRFRIQVPEEACYTPNHILHAVVDSENVVFESNEENNEATKDITLRFCPVAD